MSLFRDIADAVREQMEIARAEAEGRPRPAPVRPTSLREAGAVGSPRPGTSRPAPQGPQGRTRDFQASSDNAYPEGPPVDEQRARRRPQVQAPRVARTGSAAALRVALRSPSALRTAILVREVLDPPVALRGDDAPGGRSGNR